MTETTGLLLPVPAARVTGSHAPDCAAPVQPSRRRVCLTVAVTMALLLLLYGHTVASLAAIWARSATFAHGAVIAPISLWLVWRQRDCLALVPRNPAPLALAPLAALGLAWLAAMLGNVQVMHQFCLVLMVVCAIAAMLGMRFTRAIAFPLAYLLLAVPFGEVLVPPLIELTTACCVMVLQLAGVPVLREHHQLTLPTGSWSVVEACSGLRYLLASLAIGAVYAHLTYRRWQRRALFIVASLAVPLAANGLRAVVIILLGHWSDMQLALGVDHLLYGWVFFGLVTLLLFWCGTRWREAAPATARQAGNDETGAVAAAANARASQPAVLHGRATESKVAAMALAVLLTGAIWPASHLALSWREPAAAVVRPALQLPAPPAPWKMAPIAASDWQVQHRGAPLRWGASYSDGHRSVTLQLTWYPQQQGRDDMLAPVPPVASPDVPDWRETDLGSADIVLSGRPLRVRVAVVQASHATLRVWRWYRQRDITTASPALLKLLLARARLLGSERSAAEIVVAAPYESDAASADAAMTALLTTMLPAIEQALHHVAPR